MSAPPSDLERVLKALRLGWMFAEMRGRLRPGEKLVHVEPLSAGLRSGHSLPLTTERTAPEQLIEVEVVACSLARELGLDFDAHDLTGQAGAPGTSAERLVELAKGWTKTRGAGSEAAWTALAEFLYAWDARIQDSLAAASYSEASAYQLGRGLCEIAWLDPSVDSSENANGWAFLLGTRRVATLKRLVTRLSGYFEPFTARGISASLDAWSGTAAEAELHKDERVRARLVEQTRRWRDLLLTGLDPLTLVSSASLLGRSRQLRQVLRAFWPELTTAALGALLAALAAAVLTSSKGNDALAAFLGILGLFGVTASGLVARAKSEAQALVTKLRAALDSDLVVVAVIVPPTEREARRARLER